MTRTCTVTRQPPACTHGIVDGILSGVVDNHQAVESKRYARLEHYLQAASGTIYM